MNLKKYEQLKFHLAELIRSGQRIASKSVDHSKAWTAEQPWRDLMIRLAEDRFTVVVVGRFNRGKSSLMNALFGMERLPTGILPVTSVITYVRYGTSEQILLDYEDSRLRGPAKLHQLADYITEQRNPRNVKRVRSVEIQLPAEILRKGFCFVDTPGLGSAIFRNTKTTEAFIPEIDLLLLVTSYDSPLTEDELRFLQQASSSVGGVFLIVNKHDTVPLNERKQTLDYATKGATLVLRNRELKVFSVSARDGLIARQAKDAKALECSGIPSLEGELLRFLTADRTRAFLWSMCCRVAALQASLPQEDAAKLALRLSALRQQVEQPSGREPKPEDIEPSGDAILLKARTEVVCEMCKGVVDDVFEFLTRYQADLSSRLEIQDEHAKAGGFCAQHTWQYEQIASPLGTCSGYPRILQQSAKSLRSQANVRYPENSSLRSFVNPQCRACGVRRETEDRLLRLLTIKATQGQGESFVLCLPHLDLLLAQIPSDAPLHKKMLLRQAAIMERIAQDMQRYAVKHEAMRRYLTSIEEEDSPFLGLQLLVGHRNLNAILVVGEKF